MGEEPQPQPNPPITAPSSDDDVDDDVTLETRVLHQNNKTGKVSTHPLTIRQLCKILVTVTTTTSSAVITPDTNILLLLQDGSYSQSGWKPAKNIPIIREALTMWYVHDSSDDDNNTTTTSTPILSCRDLLVATKQQYSTNSTTTSSTTTTTYYSSGGLLTNNSQWKTLDELPYLKLAIEALTPDEGWNNSNNLFLQQQQGDDDADDDDTGDNKKKVPKKDADNDELLDAFFEDEEAATADDDKKDGEEDTYYSDGGTKYIKDPNTGNYVHEALWAAASSMTDTNSSRQQPGKSENDDSQKKRGPPPDSPNTNSNNKPLSSSRPHKKKKKAKFAARKARCWVYVTGLPKDVQYDELAKTFAKAGILDLDPATQKPKIKIYLNDDDEPKGDASICYARPESVPLAITLLDGTPLRMMPSSSSTTTSSQQQQQEIMTMTVEAAKFEQKGETFHNDQKNRVSNTQRKVAKLATQQLVDWDEGDYNGRLTGGRKGLRIIVLKNMFTDMRNLSDKEQDEIVSNIEQKLRPKLESFGAVEKITLFANHPDGVIMVKFEQPSPASDAVQALDGQKWENDEDDEQGGRRIIEACFWDGVTEYIIKDEAKEMAETEKRHEEFGRWLESQEQLPEDLKLRTE